MLAPLDRTLEPLRLPIRLCILGSTGSIGTSALEIVRAHPEKFEVVALAAGKNLAGLKAQILEFRPRYAALFDEQSACALEKELCGCSASETVTEILCGPGGVSDLAVLPEVDVVLAAVVGAAGLKPVLDALDAGKRVALANKESLVAGGALVTAALRRGGGAVVPVDSEHSAIFQALQGQRLENVSKLILTASGGAFLNLPLEKLSEVSPAEALKHPNWNMGAKVTVDSATMVNKGLEVIEAFWLFGLGVRQIEVLVHPQSIVHSLVSFADGAQIAQLSTPDMKGPIAYGLTYPGPRLSGVLPELNLAERGSLDFLELDTRRFPAVGLAKHCVEAGQGACAVFNAANESAVERFLCGQLPFTGIVPLVHNTVERFASADFSDYQGLLELVEEVKTGLAEPQSRCYL